MCLSVDMPLLENIRTGLIDPDTPKSARKKVSAEGKEWELVVSRGLVYTSRKLTYESSQMNSTEMVGRFILTMTRTSKLSTCGTG